MACDLRVARRERRQDRPARGQRSACCPGTGGTQRLARLVGKCQGDRADGDRAKLSASTRRQALGLVNEVYEGDDASFMSAVLDYARGVRAAGQAAKAVGRIKRAVQTGAEMPLRERPRARARAAAAALPERGRQGGACGLRREAQAGVQRQVALR